MQRKTLIVMIAAVILLLAVAGAWAISNNRPEKKTNETHTSNTHTDTTPEEDTPKSETVKLSLFYVAIDDNGVSGEKIGCNDSLINVETEAAKTDYVVIDSLKKLLENHEQNIGESGLYNALYQSDLKMSSWEKEGDTVTIELLGTLKSSGVCDDERIIKQIERTAAVAAGADTAVILVDGKPIKEVLGGSGA